MFNFLKRADLSLFKKGGGTSSALCSNIKKRYPPQCYFWEGHLPQTPAVINRALHLADMGDGQAFFRLAQSMEERWPHYVAVLTTRKQQTAQLTPLISPADTTKAALVHADFVSRWIHQTKFQQLLFQMLDALAKGFAVFSISWRYQEYWLPHLEWADQSFFQVSNGRLSLLSEEGESLPLKPYQALLHVHNGKSDSNLLRNGLARPALMLWFFQQFCLKDWMEYLELFGKPIRLGKFGPDASEEDKQTLLRALREINASMVAAVPKSMDINLIRDTKATSSNHLQLLDYCNLQISKLILGQTMTTDHGSSRAQAEVHDRIRASLLQSDATAIEETFNTSLIPLMIQVNFGVQTHLPRLSLTEPTRVKIQDVFNAMDRGIAIDHYVVRNILGLPHPASSPS